MLKCFPINWPDTCSVSWCLYTSFRGFSNQEYPYNDVFSVKVANGLGPSSDVKTLAFDEDGHFLARLGLVSSGLGKVGGTNK